MIQRTHYDQIYDAGIPPCGIVARDESDPKASQPGKHFMNDAIQDLIQSQVLMNQRFNFGVERMAGIGTIIYVAALLSGVEIASLAQVVELMADGVGGFPKFLGHFPQIGR